MRQAMKWLLSQAEVKAPAKVLGYERAWHPENVKAGQWAMRRWCLRGRTPYSPREDASIPRAVGSTGVWRLQNWSLKDRLRMAAKRPEKGTILPTNTGTKIRTGDRRKGWRGVVVISAAHQSSPLLPGIDKTVPSCPLELGMVMRLALANGI